MANFKQATEWLREGKKIRRKVWNSNQYIYCSNEAILWQNKMQMKFRFYQFEAVDWELYEDVCPYCKGDKKIRNPTGKCDHLYYPENINKGYPNVKEEFKTLSEKIKEIEDELQKDSIRKQKSFLNPVDVLNKLEEDIKEFIKILRDGDFEDWIKQLPCQDGIWQVCNRDFTEFKNTINIRAGPKLITNS